MIYWTDPNCRIITWNSSNPPEWLVALIKASQKDHETISLLTKG